MRRAQLAGKGRLAEPTCSYWNWLRRDAPTWVPSVDLTTQTVIKDSDFSSTLLTETTFSGGSAYITSAISNVAAGTVLLSTGDGFFAYNVANQTLSTPIALNESVTTPEIVLQKRAAIQKAIED